LWVIDKENGILKCPECGKFSHSFPVHGWHPLWNFCPYCGEDMTGGEQVELDEYITEIEEDANHYFDLVKTNNHGYGFLGNGEENCLKYAEKQKHIADYLKDYKNLLKERNKYDG